MPMNGNQLGSEIANIIIASDAPPDVRDMLISQWQRIGTAIVSHIQNNAMVPMGIAVQVSTGSGTGATTASGTVI